MENKNLPNETEEKTDVDVVEKKENKQDYLEDLQRLQAEFENFTKRSENEKIDLIKYANEKLIIKLLVVLDSFELALKNNSDEGIKLIYSEIFSILESEGVSKVDTSGLFDPNLHEALVQEEGEVDDKIIEELQAGYMLVEKLIRPAKVKISKVKK